MHANICYEGKGNKSTRNHGHEENAPRFSMGVSTIPVNDFNPEERIRVDFKYKDPVWSDKKSTHNFAKVKSSGLTLTKESAIQLARMILAVGEIPCESLEVDVDEELFAMR